MATSLGLCTLVAEDDILVSSWSLFESCLCFWHFWAYGQAAVKSLLQPFVSQILVLIIGSDILPHPVFIRDISSTGSWTQMCLNKLLKVINMSLMLTGVFLWTLAAFLALQTLAFIWSLLVSRTRTCMPPWSALRTCSPGPTQGRMVPVLRSVPRQASSTPTPCCLGHCCLPSALPVSSKTSCASKTHCQPFHWASQLLLRFLFYCNPDPDKYCKI